jgi:hypothetical protein
VLIELAPDEGIAAARAMIAEKAARFGERQMSVAKSRIDLALWLVQLDRYDEAAVEIAAGRAVFTMYAFTGYHARDACRAQFIVGIDLHRRELAEEGARCRFGHDPTPEEWLDLAQQAFDMTELDASLAALEHVDLPGAYELRAQIALARGDVNEALARATRAGVPPQLAILAELAAGHRERAAQLWRSLTEHHPAYDALVLEQLGTSADLEALAAAAQADLPPQAGGAIALARGRALLATDPARAAVLLQQAHVALSPKHPLLPDADLALGMALWSSGGDKARARRLIVKARATYERLGPGRNADRDRAGAWIANHTMM